MVHISFCSPRKISNQGHSQKFLLAYNVSFCQELNISSVRGHDRLQLDGAMDLTAAVLMRSLSDEWATAKFPSSLPYIFLFSLKMVVTFTLNIPSRLSCSTAFSLKMNFSLRKLMSFFGHGKTIPNNFTQLSNRGVSNRPFCRAATSNFFTID